MTRRTGRRAGVVVGIVAFASTLFAAGGAPIGAATENPCKVLTRKDVATVFGSAVGTPRKGFSTRSSTQCEYLVGPAADRPEGTTIVHVRTGGAQAAYDALEKRPAYVPIDGVTNGLYSQKAHVVYFLQGDVLLGVRGTFVITDPLPIHFYDAETQLTDLARIGIGRV